MRYYTYVRFIILIQPVIHQPPPLITHTRLKCCMDIFSYSRATLRHVRVRVYRCVGGDEVSVWVGTRSLCGWGTRSVCGLGTRLMDNLGRGWWITGDENV